MLLVRGWVSVNIARCAQLYWWFIPPNDNEIAVVGARQQQQQRQKGKPQQTLMLLLQLHHLFPRLASRAKLSLALLILLRFTIALAMMTRSHSRDCVARLMPILPLYRLLYDRRNIEQVQDTVFVYIFRCTVCEKRFSRSDHLAKHLKVNLW